ncbi:XRE family transcriptional regulator [Nonomuraea sp. SYSU D8015]|uniref:XRE family transcriptional regulator n=1 Tax=Nonomuraea sp. SYSU D8015 TaxID=2593644 RepID=UPI001CB70F4D|nr:XRE family transcriptional regulator [Nonomuraea sp. SYSU D8015]
MDDRPAWARRIRAERLARGWTQDEAVHALAAHTTEQLPDFTSLKRSWQRWESGETHPDHFYAPLIAATFGTVTHAMFPLGPRDHGRDKSVAELDTLEIITRLRASTVDDATIDGLHITVDQLCSDYPHLPAGQLLVEGRQWLARLTTLLDHRLTLKQHRDVLSLAGWLALLVGCVEADTGDERSAEATRQAALSMGLEAENGGIQGWAHEMAAWFALTRGDYRSVIAASDRGLAVAGGLGVAVQLYAQKAKAWARIGDRRQVEVALDEGRKVLESLPVPENLDNHFNIDPLKYDFYSMDAYRILGENERAELYAGEVIRAHTSADGEELAPMRISEARLTLGVIAARRGDIEQAVGYGRRSLKAQRRSVPHLIMSSRELVRAVGPEHADRPEVRAYLDELRDLTSHQAKAVLT